MQKCIGKIGNIGNNQPTIVIQEPFLCDPDTQNRNKFTPLLVAAKENHFEVMELLLQAGANPNTQDPLSGMTPLHLVVCKYHTQRRVPTCQVMISSFLDAIASPSTYPSRWVGGSVGNVFRFWR